MASPTDGLLPPTGGGPKSNYSSKKVLQEINAETLKWKKNLLDVEKTMQRIYTTWSKMYGGKGKVGTAAAGGMGGGSGPGGFEGLAMPSGGGPASIGGMGVPGFNPHAGGGLGMDIKATSEQIMARMDQFKVPKTKLDYGMSIASGVLKVGAVGYGMMPNTMDAVNQRLMTQGVATITGQNYQSLIKQSNAFGNGGITSATGMQGAMATLSQAGVLPTMSTSYKNFMGEIGGLSAMTGMSNEQVAAGQAAVNNNNFIRLGMRARDSKGNLRPIGELANDLMRRMYPGQKPTVANIQQGFRPGSKAYADIQAAAGGDSNLANLLTTTMLMQAKSKSYGKPLNLKSAKDVMDNVMKLSADDPLRKILKSQTSEARLLQGTGKGLTQGFGAALDTQTALNNGFSKLAETLPGVVDNLGRLKSFLETLPQAGNAGATAAGGLASAAHSAGNMLTTYLGFRMAGKVAGAAGKFLGFGAEAAGAAALAGEAAAVGGAAAATGAVAATGAAATVAAGGAAAAAGGAAAAAGGAAAAGAGGAAAAGATAGATALGLLTKFKRAIFGGGGKHVAKKVGGGLLAKYLPYAAGLGTVALGMQATNWAVPALRRFGASHGIKEHSALDNFGTTLGYMGGYAAAGASKFGVAGAIAGTALGLARGTAYTIFGMKPNEHTKDFLREQMRRGDAATASADAAKWQHDHGYLDADPNTGGDTGLPDTSIIKALRDAGFGAKGQKIGLAIAKAESSGDPHAHNTNSSTGDNSYGLFQINMIGKMGPARRKQFGLKSNDELFDPLTNAKAAFAISNKGKNWSPWSTYKSGAYKKFLNKHDNEDNHNTTASNKNKVNALHGGVNGGVNAPADGGITADYGQKPKTNKYWKWKGYHTGRDYGVAAGSTVKSFKEGVVKYAGKGQGLSGAGEPYGNIVVVDHGGYQSMYAHLSKSTVKAGQHVKAGQQIALSGQSGSGAAAGPHLHFEIRKGTFPNANETDPRPYLSGVAGKPTGGFLNSIKNTVGGAISSAEHALHSAWTASARAFGSVFGSLGEGSTQAPGPNGNQPQNTLSVSGINTDWTSAFGGDMGAPTGVSSGMGSSNGVTIHMNVTVNGTSTNDARKFASDVKNILEKDLRTANIGSY